MPFIDDLPSKGQIFEYWKDRLSKLGFFVDWGEPGCWVCGFHYGIRYDVRRPSANWKLVLSRWNKIPLQRCHIVPRSLGGTNKPSNLFLMCRECHDIAPNTNNRKVFFDWARAQSSWRREMAKINAAVDSFGVKEADLDSLSDVIESEKFKRWISGKIGLHRPQSNYAPRSSRITPASIVGLAVSYQRLARNRPGKR